MRFQYAVGIERALIAEGIDLGGGAYERDPGPFGGSDAVLGADRSVTLRDEP